MTVKSACPPPEAWARLLDDDVAGLDLAMLESHLNDCDSCSEVLIELAGDTSAAGPTPRRGDPVLGRASFAMLARVAAAARMSGIRRSGRIEEAVPPEIPGLVDWEVVGRGGMGVVFRAREVELDRPVAVKVLSSGGQSSPSARARAIREAMLMASLRHPNVVPVYRSGEARGIPFLVMEWVGGTLRGRIEDHPLPAREAAETVRDLARAIAEAHALGIIHRDLKPENVLLEPPAGPGSRPVPKLTDFGLARRGDGDGMTEAGAVLGTPGYMAPEQTGLVRGGADVGPATDIHGLGAILHACLTGRAPYSGRSSWEMLARAAQGSPPSVREHRPDVPRDLVTIVDKCLEASPSRRYRSAGELADDLGRFLEGRPIARAADLGDRAMAQVVPAPPRPGRVRGAPGPLLDRRDRRDRLPRRGDHPGLRRPFQGASPDQGRPLFGDGGGGPGASRLGLSERRRRAETSGARVRPE